MRSWGLGLHDLMLGSAAVKPATGSHDAHVEAPALRLAAGLFGGFVLLALVNAVAIAVAVPLPLAGRACA